jgi:hypothetical protein
MAPGAKIAKTADRKKVMDTTKSTDCPKCGKPTRIVKRVKDRERGVPGGVYISCSVGEFGQRFPGAQSTAEWRVTRSSPVRQRQKRWRSGGGGAGIASNSPGQPVQP